MSRRSRMLAGLLVAMLLFAGCSGSEPADRRYVVAFSQCNNAEPYRAAQNALMRKLFDAKGDVDLVIADAQQDNSRQIAQVETFIRQRPDLLIVAPNERAPLTRVMQKAVEAGIPVICLERDISEPHYTTFVGADNLAIGRMAGELIVRELTRRNGMPRGKVAEIRGLPGVEAEMERYRGAREVLKGYPDIRIVHEAVANWLQNLARDRMSEILRAQPQIDLVYAHNDPMAVGAYLAARELGREKDMLFIGVDGLGGPAGGVRKVIDGVLTATFYYPLCVDKAVEIGYSLLTEPGFRPERSYILEPRLVDRENALETYEELAQ